MSLVGGVVGSDFTPESTRVVGVIEVSEFVNENVVAQRFGNLHEANIK